MVYLGLQVRKLPSTTFDIPFLSVINRPFFCFFLLAYCFLRPALSTYSVKKHTRNSMALKSISTAHAAISFKDVLPAFQSRNTARGGLLIGLLIDKHVFQILSYTKFRSSLIIFLLNIPFFRFVKFVNGPYILKRVNTFDLEMSQLEETRTLYSQRLLNFLFVWSD